MNVTDAEIERVYAELPQWAHILDAIRAARRDAEANGGGEDADRALKGMVYFKPEGCRYRLIWDFEMPPEHDLRARIGQRKSASS
jgi:hypothetical protein